MTIAFDAISNRSGVTGDLSFTHTPVGTPAGVLVLVGEVDEFSGLADGVVSVSYGGVSLSEVLNSPLLYSNAGYSSNIHGFFLGNDIPTGAQTVAVTVSGSAKRAARAITVTAAKNTRVLTTNTITGIGSDPSGTLLLDGMQAFVVQAGGAAVASAANVSPLTDWTSRYEYDPGTMINYCYTYNTIASSNVTFGATVSSNSCNSILAVAIAEAASLPESNLRPLIHSILR